MVVALSPIKGKAVDVVPVSAGLLNGQGQIGRQRFSAGRRATRQYVLVNKSRLKFASPDFGPPSVKDGEQNNGAPIVGRSGTLSGQHGYHSLGE